MASSVIQLRYWQELASKPTPTISTTTNIKTSNKCRTKVRLLGLNQLNLSTMRCKTKSRLMCLRVLIRLAIRGVSPLLARRLQKAMPRRQVLRLATRNWKKSHLKSLLFLHLNNVAQFQRTLDAWSIIWKTSFCSAVRFT